MPTRRPRRRPGENRERLLEAGLFEFGLFGFAASTAAIAARAELPQPHVYANFKTKQELFAECLERVVSGIGVDPVAGVQDAVAGAPLQDSDGGVGEDVLARFLFQSVSQLTQWQSAPREAILGLPEALGQRRFDSILLRGAHSLLSLEA